MASRSILAGAGGAVAALVFACSAAESSPTSPPVTEPPPTDEDAGTSPGPTPVDAATNDASSAGCAVGSPSGVGAVTKKQLTAAGKSRTFHLSVPAAYATVRSHPVVFVLHGATDTSPEDMKDWFPVEAGMPTALFVYPLALPRTRSDGSGGLVTRWDIDGQEDLSFFDAMLKEISDAYCLDRTHVFVTGFSSGGNFAHQLACLRQPDLRGFAPVAGPGPFTDACGGAVAAWMTHDVNDDGLPVADARNARDFWADANGCGTTWAAGSRAECKTNTSCPKAAPVTYCESTGVGHAIPDYAAGDIASFFTALTKASP
jgi:polyhydroxybutyrate depolymerase